MFQTLELFVGDIFPARLALLLSTIFRPFAVSLVVPFVEMPEATSVAVVRLRAPANAASLKKAGPPRSSGLYVVTELPRPAPLIRSSHPGHTSTLTHPHTPRRRPA